ALGSPVPDGGWKANRLAFPRGNATPAAPRGRRDGARVEVPATRRIARRPTSASRALPTRGTLLAVRKKHATLLSDPPSLRSTGDPAARRHRLPPDGLSDRHDDPLRAGRRGPDAVLPAERRRRPHRHERPRGAPLADARGPRRTRRHGPAAARWQHPRDHRRP